jgi:hypothetical protein
MPRVGGYLFIVAHDQPDLWAHLAREFHGEEGVDVVIDRRRIERRLQRQPASPERRRAERRARPSLKQMLDSMSFALVSTE